MPKKDEVGRKLPVKAQDYIKCTDTNNIPATFWDRPEGMEYLRTYRLELRQFVSAGAVL